MNLLKYRLWKDTKIWLMVIIPLIFVFLFIQAYISLFLLFVIFARLLYVKLVQSAFYKSAREARDESDRKLDEMVVGIKNEIAIFEVEESLKLTKDFPGVYIDFINETNEYIVTYKNKTAHFQNLKNIREWLEKPSE